MAKCKDYRLSSNGPDEKDGKKAYEYTFLRLKEEFEELPLIVFGADLTT